MWKETRTFVPVPSQSEMSRPAKPSQNYSERFFLKHVKGEDISFLRNIMNILNYARACHGCNTNFPTCAVDGPDQ